MQAQSVIFDAAKSSNDEANAGVAGVAAGVGQRYEPSPSFGYGAAASECLSLDPSDLSEADARILDAIAAALDQGPRAVVEAILSPNSTNAKQRTLARTFNDSPLHVVCALFPNHGRALISRLLAAYPDGAREKKGVDGQLPLHVAARHSNEVVIKELLAAYPDGAREKDASENLPLHLAVEVERRQGSDAVIKVLLAAYPDGAREKGADGQLPLHLAARHSNEVVIKELLAAYPDGAREKNKSGHLPLAYAVHLNSKAVIQELLTSFFVPDHVFAYFQTLEEDQDGDLQNSEKQYLIDNMLSVISEMNGVNFISQNVMDFSIHPLYSCIQLSTALARFSREMRSIDIRKANNADEKASELEQLNCAITRNFTNNTVLGQEFSDILEIAADAKMKFFISEPVCSRHLDDLWNPWITPRQPVWLTILVYLPYALLNVLRGAIFFDGYNPNFRMPPFVRFLLNRASYLAFLVFLLQLPLQGSADELVYNFRLEIFLAYWLFDICFSEAAEFFDIMKKHRLTFFETVAKYVDDPWNIYDVASLSVAVAAVFVRSLVHAGNGEVSANVSNQLYAWALALLWGRLVNVLAMVSFIGPLLIMVLLMVFKDLTKFAVLVVLMELPFVAALFFLESGNSGNEAFATFTESALSFFKIVIGQGPDISSVTASSSVLLSIGSVLLSVLLLNLLIAMFSKTFDTIVENSMQEFLLQKAQLAFVWIRAPRLPPPLAFPLALKDLLMALVARRISCFRKCCAGWSSDKDGHEPVEPPAPTFDRLHFFKIIFPKEIPSSIDRENLAAFEAWSKQAFDMQYMKECEEKYPSWGKQVLADLEENAEFNSEAQMDKFKSRMLRGMETAVESNGKIDQLKEQMAEQMQTLTDVVQSQQAQIQQLHSSMQLMLKKFDP